jgi:hypothetical protein
MELINRTFKLTFIIGLVFIGSGQAQFGYSWHSDDDLSKEERYDSLSWTWFSPAATDDFEGGFSLWGDTVVFSCNVVSGSSNRVYYKPGTNFTMLIPSGSSLGNISLYWSSTAVGGDTLFFSGVAYPASPTQVYGYYYNGAYTQLSSTTSGTWGSTDIFYYQGNLYYLYSNNYYTSRAESGRIYRLSMTGTHTSMATFPIYDASAGYRPIVAAQIGKYLYVFATTQILANSAYPSNSDLSGQGALFRYNIHTNTITFLTQVGNNIPFTTGIDYVITASDTIIYVNAWGRNTSTSEPGLYKYSVVGNSINYIGLPQAYADSSAAGYYSMGLTTNKTTGQVYLGFAQTASTNKWRSRVYSYYNGIWTNLNFPVTNYAPHHLDFLKDTLYVMSDNNSYLWYKNNSVSGGILYCKPNSP